MHKDSSHRVRTIAHLRWWIAGMLMLATTINYLDRQSLSVAQVVLEEKLGLTSDQYGTVVASFQVAYGVMLPLAGLLIDRLGVRIGFTLCIFWWSLASMAHAFARGVVSLSIFRFLLGMGEAGNFPGSVKTIAEWFPPKERATATGIFNLGAGAGAVLAPPVVGWIILRHGWEWAFLLTGAIGFVWMLGWLYLYREPGKHRHLSPEELNHIRSGQAAAEPAVVDRRGTWREALARRELYPLIVGRVLSDPVWLFYLFWLPHYFKHYRGFDLKAVAMFAWMPYLAADFGSLAGGALSSWFVRRGLPVLSARKAAMCVFAALMPLAIPAVFASSWPAAMFFISIATFGHQSWAASFITLPADLFPKRMVASAYGLSAMCGFLAGAIFTKFVGKMVGSTGYVPVFIAVGCMHVVATVVLVIWIRSPRPTPALERS